MIKRICRRLHSWLWLGPRRAREQRVASIKRLRENMTKQTLDLNEAHATQKQAATENVQAVSNRVIESSQLRVVLKQVIDRQREQNASY